MLSSVRNFFKRSENAMVEELNKLVANLTTYPWAHNKDGFYLHFPINCLDGDFLHKQIQWAFKDLTTKIVPIDFNAKSGMRLIITPENKLTVEHINKAKEYLANAYPNAPQSIECKK